MRIALISPPYKHKIFSENLSAVDEEFCLAPPIILAYVAAILEKHGHKVMLLDARVLKLTKEKALNIIMEFGPDLLGFRAETYNFHDALEWMRYLKPKLGIPVIAGGVNMTLYPKEVLSHKEIDYGVIGEAIESLPKLLSFLEDGKDFRKMPGIAYRNDAGEVVVNPDTAKEVSFDDYPFPARHLLQNDKYYSFISQRKNFTIMLTSTGCPFKCTFCAIPTRYRARSPESVIKEIEVCYRDFGVREIDFFDAVLFMPRDRILEIFRQLRGKKMDIEWSCRSRVDTVDEEILREAARCGCRQIYYGIESVEQSVLDGINKRIGPERVIEAIRLSKKYGIKAMGFFMVGNPGETKESVRKTIEFAKRLDLDFIQVCRTIAKPGTQLDKIMIEKTGRDYWREHVRGADISRRLPTPWANLTDEDMESLTKEFYLRFYFRPRLIWKRITQLRSLEEFMRYCRVGWKMLMHKSELSSHILTDTSEAEAVLAESANYLAQARKLKVAVVIPTYNEKDNLEKIVRSVTEVLPQACLVIVDDNSPDGTGDLADGLSLKNKNIHVIHRKGRRGLGFAYIDGFKYVLRNLDSDYIFEMDADLSHNPQYFPVFLYYNRQFGIVTGSRFLNRVSIKNRTLWRNVISKTTKWFVNIVTGMRLTDITTGFKSFRRSALEKIPLERIRSRGYAFQIEVSYELNRKGELIKEVPIIFVERTVGASKMSPGIMLEGILLIIRLSLRNFRPARKRAGTR